MITGDSITQGFHGDYTWRYRLDKEFVRQDVDVDLVGSQSKPFDSTGWGGATYADAHFDSDHFAFAGTTLAQQATWIGPEIMKQDPDLVVLASGVNDLRRGSTPQETIAHLNAWLSAARSADPDIDVVISPVLPSVDRARPRLAASITTYDVLLRAAITGSSTPQSTLTLADTTFGWDMEAFTVENLHPSPVGETHIAQRIAETLNLMGVLPQAPSIFHAVRWTRTEAVKASARGNSLDLTWPDHTISGAKVSTRRVGGGGTISPYAYRGGHYTLNNLVYGATYDVRVQLVRGRLVGPWGPATRVRVPRPVRPAAVARVIVNKGGVRWTASTGASSYVVQLHRKGRPWVTRRTSELRVLMREVDAAKVVAVNAGGQSASRTGSR